VADVLAPDFPPAPFDAIYTVNCLPIPTPICRPHSTRGCCGRRASCTWGYGRGSRGDGRDDHEPKRFFAWRTDQQIQEYARRVTIVDFHPVRPTMVIASSR
jgi:hypothetical protein